MKIKYLAVLLVLFAALGGSAFAQNNARMLSTPNAQTGTSYTFVAADTTRVVTFSNAGSIAATLPNGATFGFGSGTMLSVVNLGAGTVTITCSSCTITANGSASATLSLATGQGADIYGGIGGSAVNYVALPSPSGANAALLNANNAFSGNNTHSGSETFNGSVTMANPCLISGTIYVNSGGCYTTLAAAFAACSAPNCTINMIGASAATTLGTFDPGTAFPVTIYLGPYSYTLTQIVIRDFFQLIASGSGATSIVQSTAGTAPFVLAAAGGTFPANRATQVTIKGFRLNAAGGSTTDGFSIVGNKDGAGVGGGMWYSSFEDIRVGDTTQFGRNQMRFDTATENLTASPTGSNQFISFKNVFAFRAKNNTNPTLLVTGSFSGQFSFNNCQFDGQANNLDTTANTYNMRFDDGGDAFVPYSITMNQVTSQWAGGVGSALIFVGGLQGYTCDSCHFENATGVIKEAVGAGGHGNWGIGISHAYIASNVGVAAGNGYIADLGTQSGLDFSANAYFGTPDAVFLGTLTYLNAGPNWNASSGAMEPWTQISMGLGITVATLPAAASNAGKQIYVTDSTAIAAEGQACAGGGAVKALAFSNGAGWKCF